MRTLQTSARLSRATAACLIAIALGGCGDQSVKVGTTDVSGTVGGVVLDASAGLAPLGGAQLTVVAGGRSFTGTADSNGLVSVSGVPAGSLVLHLAAAGHVDVYLEASLDTAAGNFPLSNPSYTFGPIALAPSTGVFTVRLVDDAGAAAANVKVTARAAGSYLDESSGAAVSAGSATAVATSGADGLVAFSGLPDWTAVGAALSDGITVSVPPVMLQNAGEAYDFLGGDFSFNGRKASSSTPTIVLAGPRSALSVLSSNVDYLQSGSVATSTPSVIPVSGPINVVFNEAVNPSSVRAIFYTETGALAAVQPTPTVSANVVTLGFGGKTLDAATRYDLELHASSLSDQSKEFNSLAPFFSQLGAGSTVALTNDSGVDPNDMNDYVIEFSEPIGVGNGSAAAIPCVVFYEANLDGNAQVTSPGEWNPNGDASLKCNPGNPHIGYYLRPDEPTFSTSGSAPLTGFTRRWRITVKPYGALCVGNYQCCPSGATVHLQFSRNTDPGTVLRRLNGAPVPDITFQLPMNLGC